MSPPKIGDVVRVLFWRGTHENPFAHVIRNVSYSGYMLACETVFRWNEEERKPAEMITCIHCLADAP